MPAEHTRWVKKRRLKTKALKAKADFEVNRASLFILPSDGSLAPNFSLTSLVEDQHGPLAGED